MQSREFASNQIRNLFIFFRIAAGANNFKEKAKERPKVFTYSAANFLYRVPCIPPGQISVRAHSMQFNACKDLLLKVALTNQKS